MSDTKVQPCTCKSEYQDKLYGKGMRVHNHGVKLDVYTCTVCKPNRVTIRGRLAVAAAEAEAAKMRK